MTKAETTVERVGGYRVVRRLATGGTSDVLLAKAEGPLGFERTVVLKLLLSQFGGDDDFTRMFAREASAYARLSHPSIVQLFDFFAQPSGPATPLQAGVREGQLVMVLEYVDGPPLTRLRTMLRAVGKELEDRAAIHVAARVFDALAAAHGAVDDAGLLAPVIHRDVNPSNVLVPWDGHVKLADFGVAKVTGLSHQSVAGMIKGTYGYMAPEQVTGEPVTPRADVYAAAIILWELLTKRRAFQRGALPEVEALRAMAEPRLLSLDTIRPDVDKPIRDAVTRALEPRADRRTITAEEMVSILCSIVPTDEGRERLVSALGLVRHDPRAAMAAVSNPPNERSPRPPNTVQDPPTVQAAGARPPPEVQRVGRQPEGPRTVQGVAPPAAGSSGRGLLPKPAVPPRSASVQRMKASLGRPPPEPPADPSRGETLQTPEGQRPPKIAIREPLPAPAHQRPPELPKRHSASARLAVAVRDTKRDLKAAVDASSGAPSSERGLRTPPGEIGLKEAIDEILRGVPSSMPPSMLQQTDELTATANVSPDTTRGIGRLPAAPPPMQAGFVPQGPPPSAEDFGGAMRELIKKAEAPTVAPPSDLAPPTPRMVPVQPLNKTLAMEARPDGSKSDEAASTPFAARPPGLTSTGPMPTFLARPLARHGPLPAPPSSQPTSSVGSHPPPTASASGTAQPSSRDSSAPEVNSTQRRSGTSAVAIAALFSLAMGAAIAGTVAYVRHHRTRTDGTHATLATTPGPTATLSAAASAHGALSVSAATSSSAMPTPSATFTTQPSATASTIAVPSAIAAARPSAGPSASASAAPSGELPEGMGILTTTGTAPGRRIFVDDKTLGQTPESVTVKCGTHWVRLGSTGKPQSIDVPCGGEIGVGDKF